MAQATRSPQKKRSADGPRSLSRTKERIDRVFAAQQQHHQHLARTTARQRKQKLRRLLRWIQAHRSEIHAALQADFRKPETETDLSEILVATSEIRHALRHLRSWMAPRPAGRSLALLTASAEIRFEPRGVVLIISPWNFPFNITVGPLISAIAAGNCVVLKPSEFTPATSAVMAKMVADLFPENEVSLIEGDKDVAELLLAKPFHHIFFTGSPAVGKIIQERAARHLSTVTLELGGKSPAIVDEDVNLDDAVQKIIWGKFVNNGQTCIAPDYVLVHENRYEEFLEKAGQQVQAFYGKTARKQQESPDYARIISEHHHERLTRMLRGSLRMGARLICGGIADKDDRYIAPTIVSHVPLDAPLMKEEIFGPILPVISVPSMHRAVEIVRQMEKPLALYVFSSKRKHVKFVLAETTAGGTCVNDTLIHFLHPELPFGGVNFSGSGNAHGFYGFRAFSHERAILHHHRFAPMKFLYPPYTPLVRKLARLLVQFL